MTPPNAKAALNQVKARVWCMIFGHYWDYSYGMGKVRCIQCRKTHPGITRGA